jgi:uncharacterized repeat protein (TIGR01451 family)
MRFAMTPRPRFRFVALAVLAIGLVVAPAGAQTGTLGTVVAWGCGGGVGNGQCTVPIATVSGVTAIAAGHLHSLALKQDGGVVAWGCAGTDTGQCVVPAAAAHGVTAIAAGGWHSLALKDDGGVVAWGCGIDDLGQCTVPASAAAGVTAIAAGEVDSLALKQGGVVAWGCGGLWEYGQCTVPTAAASGVTAIAAGAYHSLALKDGGVVAWGCGVNGVKIPLICTVPAAAASGVTAIAAGTRHSLALKQDGSVLAWGDCDLGQCSVPAAATSGVRAIAAAGDTSVALKEDGSVLVWGSCESQQCAVPAAASGVTDVAAGAYHVLALRAAGDARADLSLSETASHDAVQVGDTLTYDFTVDNAGPQAADRVQLNAQLPIGLSFGGLGTTTGGASCAFRALRRTLDCSWASIPGGAHVRAQILMTVNQPGELVTAATVRSDTIDPDSADNGSTTTVQARLSRVRGLVVAWGCGGGDNDWGQCNVPAGLSGVTAIAAGDVDSLALKDDGTVVAWGCASPFDFGQCNVPPGLSGVTAIAAAEGHSLALKTDGAVVAWGCGGSRDFGQCSVPSGLSAVVAIAAGASHSLALKSDGTVVAWGCGGFADDGQCNVPAGLSGVTAIAAGGAHSLALKADGTVVVWGCLAFGWCSVPAGLSGVKAIAAGAYSALAVKSDGTVTAWGFCGEDLCTVPSGLSGVTAVAGGYAHSLALKDVGTVAAWGCSESPRLDFGQCNVLSGLSGVTAIAAGFSHSLALVGRTTPDPPTGLAATPANGQATVSWSVPAFDGGSAITGYEVTPYVGAVPQATTIVGALTQATVTGLTNGTSYTFRVAARNALGTGPQSAESNAVTPAAPKFTLSVAKAGTGAGTVTSNAGGINCGATCSAMFGAGTAVSLTAAAADGSTFAGWSGDCSGTDTCTLAMDRDRTATAVFTPVPVAPRTLAVGRAGNGGGSVLLVYPGGATDCPSACMRDFADGTQVTLTPTASAGSTFTGWTGDCSGTGGCRLTMDQNHSTTAVFALIPVAPGTTSLTVGRSGRGAGSVSSSPAGIDCGSACTHEFELGTVVKLTAVAAAGSAFAGWSGACSGNVACTVTLDAAKTVTATFNQVLTPVSCVVPNVKGRPLATAKRRIVAAHCKTGKVTRAKSKTVRKGNVISQSRRAGTRLAAGSKVNLVVSRGRR